MKLLVRVCLFLAMLMTSSSLSAEVPTQPALWFCRVVGIQNGKTPEQVVYISKIFSDDMENHYEKREQAFIEHITKDITRGRFEPQFDAKCRDYINHKTIKKHRQEEIKTAREHKFSVYELDWSWRPREVTSGP